MDKFPRMQIDGLAHNAQLRICLVLKCWLLMTWAIPCRGDELLLTRDGLQSTLVGEIVVEAQDGGLMFRANDGRVWVLAKDEYDQVNRDGKPFRGLDQSEAASQILSELPAGFEVHTTKNYVIVYNTSQAYAKWVGALYERLYNGFQNFWKTKGIPLTDPDVPLCVILFDSKENYIRYTRNDLGQDPGTMVAYYSLVTNRVAMFDLTGGQAGSVRDLRNSDQINAMLSQPGSEALVATVVHEATHQIMFNRGMQQRLADTPLWVNEGLAVFFETPDLDSRSGWRAIGKINRMRYLHFRAKYGQRPRDSLYTLIVDDKRFRDAGQALDAYAEAWAINFYLIKRHSKKYVAYLIELSNKPPLQVDTPEERIALFEKHFGAIDKFDKPFLEFISKLD